MHTEKEREGEYQTTALVLGVIQFLGVCLLAVFHMVLEVVSELVARRLKFHLEP